MTGSEKRPENVMLWEPRANIQGIATNRESLEDLLRNIDTGRIDLVRYLLVSMIGRMMAEETQAVDSTQ